MSDELNGPEGEVDSTTTTADVQNTDVQTQEAQADGGAPDVSPELDAKFAQVFGDGNPADSEGAKSQPQQAQTQAKPVLPAEIDPVLIHSAKRAGVTEEMIAQSWATNPVATLTQLQHMHTTANEMSRQFAEIGLYRQQLQMQQQAMQQQPPQQNQAQQFELLNKIYGDQLETISDLFGGTENFGQFMQPMLNFVQQMVSPFQEAQQYVTEQKVAALRNTVNGFFDETAKGFKEFAPIYGEPGKEMTPQQHSMRVEVAKLADAIYIGAQSLGKEVTHQDALRQAHFLANRDKLQQLERKNIAGKIQRRSNQLTIRPGSSAPRSAAQGTNQAAMDAYRQKAQELGMDIS